MLWKNRKNKRMISNSKRKTQEYDTPTQLCFFSEMGGCRQISYVLPEVMKNLITNIDKTVDQMLNNVSLDEFNTGNFMDDYINGIAALAKNDIITQSIEHAHVIESIKEIEQGYLLAYRAEQDMIKGYISGDVMEVFIKEAGDNEKEENNIDGGHADKNAEETTES